MERYDVSLAEQAAADIRDIARYVAVDLREPGTAEKLLDRFDEALRSLETMPERNPPARDTDLAAMGLRIQRVGNYLMFYVVDWGARRVNVIRVQYGRRDWVKLLWEEDT